METINEQQFNFIHDLLRRRAFGWIEPEHLVAEALLPYNKKELHALEYNEFMEIICSSIFWDFNYLESYEEYYEDNTDNLTI